MNNDNSVKYIHSFIINDEGFILDTVSVHVDEKENVPDNIITTPFKTGSLYIPKWDGIWIEGATPEEIDKITRVESPEPTTEDFLLDLDYRVSAIEIGV